MPPDKTIEQKEKFAQMAWTAGIVGFFSIQAVIWAIAITLTSTDKTHAVIADYERGGLSWDQTQQMIKESEALGWSTNLSIDTQSSLPGRRTITLTVLDRNQQPIEVAEINLEVFHRGQAAIVYDLKLLPSDEPGVYVGQLEMTRPGYWQFSGAIDHPTGFYLYKETKHAAW